MSAPAHRCIETNGIRMHLAEQGSGPLVLLCHGYPESWYSWRHQLSALAEAGFHAVAPDMRGYGQTDAPEAIDQYTLMHLVGDMVGVLDAMGAETAVIVGHDWGAPVAWLAALLRPDRFQGVAGLSVPHLARGLPPTSSMPRTPDAVYYQLYIQTPGQAEAELESDLRTYIRGIIVRFSGDYRSSPGDSADVGMISLKGGLCERLARARSAPPAPLPPWATEADVDFFVAEFSRTGLRGGMNYYRNIDRNRELLAPFADARITVPALFLAGARDPVRTYPGFAEALADQPKLVPDLRGTMWLPECGHWLHQEQPEAVNAALIKFLRSL
jgi:pimeloyl-ACP methyl ester carboxylesterase